MRAAGADNIDRVLSVILWRSSASPLGNHKDRPQFGNSLTSFSFRLKGTSVSAQHVRAQKSLMAEKRVEDSIFARRPIATAIALGVISLAPHFFLSPEMSLSFAAVLIGVIAGVYFGFAVVRSSNWEQLIELNVASSFGVAALLGNGVSPWFLPVAYLAHGLWDFAHHNSLRLRLVSIPQWYIPWCAIIDWIIGLGLSFIWHAKRVI
jgi:hypothetical protein